MAVMLETSLGEMVIDLFTEKCPIAAKNFLKLCKIKYYNHCMFHNIQKDFIAQTGDPTGTGRGGDSIYKMLHGDEYRFFKDEVYPKDRHDKIGLVGMANAGKDLNASQFYITTRAGVDSLDGKHTIFGEIAEGLETLLRINEAFVDDNGRPLKNIRIKHTFVLEDPFDDPPGLEKLIPDASPEPPPPTEEEKAAGIRLEDNWVPMDEGKDPEELEKELKRKEAHSRAVVLEMVGDLPEADVKPPENVLFVCKLNPVTQDEDLEVIFSRFGTVVSADVIRDYKTGDSLCYAFIEFETQEACEAAYFKMDNVLIDDRRIHVDFSQSVGHLWKRYRRFGTKDVADAEKDPKNTEEDNRPKFELKDRGGQIGGLKKRYDYVFDEGDVDTQEKPKDSTENDHREAKRKDEKERPDRRQGEEVRNEGKAQKNIREERRPRGEEGFRDRERHLERNKDRIRDRDRDDDRSYHKKREERRDDYENQSHHLDRKKQDLGHREDGRYEKRRERERDKRTDSEVDRGAKREKREDYHRSRDVERRR